MHLFKRGVASGLAVLITVQATGCATWKTVPLPPPWAVSQHPGRKVQVITRTGRAISADSARIEANTLIALRDVWCHGRCRAEGGELGRQVADTIPLAEVTEVQVRKVSAFRTVGLVLGILAGASVAFGIAFVIACDGTCIY